MQLEGNVAYPTDQCNSTFKMKQLQEQSKESFQGVRMGVGFAFPMSIDALKWRRRARNIWVSSGKGELYIRLSSDGDTFGTVCIHRSCFLLISSDDLRYSVIAVHR